MKTYRRNSKSFSRSHLQRHLQNQSVRNLLLVFGGTIILIVALFLLGPELLIKMSLFAPNRNATTETKQTASQESVYIEPPILNPVAQATKSASITIEGNALPKQTIKLYVNGKFTDNTRTRSSGKFTFANVTLEKGLNEIKVKAQNEKKQSSDYSDAVTVTYRDKAPTLEISNPQDGQTFAKGSNTLKVTGKTDTNAKVTINDAWTVTNGDGSFSYPFRLNDGENTIKVVATDDADNKTEKEIKIKVE